MAPLGGMPLARPLEELSPQATERALAVTVYLLRLRFAQPPLPQGEAMNTGKGIFGACLPVFAGKAQENRRGFSWSVQGSLRGNRNPLRLVFFLPLFLLEKQKKKKIAAPSDLQKASSLSRLKIRSFFAYRL